MPQIVIIKPSLNYYFRELSYKDSNLEMTKPESVGLPFDDCPISQVSEYVQSTIDLSVSILQIIADLNSFLWLYTLRITAVNITNDSDSLHTLFHDTLIYIIPLLFCKESNDTVTLKIQYNIICSHFHYLYINPRAIHILHCRNICSLCYLHGCSVSKSFRLCFCLQCLSLCSLYNGPCFRLTVFGLRLRIFGSLRRGSTAAIKYFFVSFFSCYDWSL